MLKTVDYCLIFSSCTEFRLAHIPFLNSTFAHFYRTCGIVLNQEELIQNKPMSFVSMAFEPEAP